MDMMEFSKRIALLTDELYAANEYFLGYVHLHNQLASTAKEANIVPGFFQMTSGAYLELFVLKLAHLFDDSREAVSLMKIPGWIEQNKEINAEAAVKCITLKSITSPLEECTENLLALKCLRDKQLAHIDKKQLDANIWHTAGINVQQYRKLITTAHDILCICKLILNEPTPILGIGIEAEIVTLFNAISEESSFANQIN